MEDAVIIEPDQNVLAGRKHWQYTGAIRPPFAVDCKTGEESVWDFPRPPRIEPMSAVVEVFAGNDCIARTTDAVRVCETAGAPTWYLPPTDVDSSLVNHNGGHSICEWKGVAQGFSVGNTRDAGWRYTQVFEEFAALYLWCAFYPDKLRCLVDGEAVQPQPGGYYGGWVTRNLVGPIKGGPGSSGW